MKRLLLLTAFVLWPTAAQAGPWTQDEGHAWLETSLTWLRATGFYDGDGELQELDDPLDEFALHGYVELGLHDRLTLFGAMPLLMVVNSDEAPESSTADIGDLELGARFAILRGRVPVAVTGSFTTPSGDPEGTQGLPTGAGAISAALLFSVGYSLETTPLYGFLEGGFRVRGSGFADEWRGAFEVGYSFAERYAVQLRTDAVIAVRNGRPSAGPLSVAAQYQNDERFISPALGLRVKLNDSFQVSAGVRTALLTENTPSGIIPRVGLAYTY